MKTSGTFYTILFTFITAFVFVAILSLTNSLTSPRIEANAALALQKAVLLAAGVAFTDDNEAGELYARYVKQQPDQTDFYIIRQPDKLPLYALRFAGQGLWGTITGVLVVDRQLSLIQGMEIISHNETPGLGGKIADQEFKAQLRNERLGPGGTLTVGAAGPGDNDHSNSRIDGITGATRTAQLLEGILNRALGQLKTILGGLA